MRATVLCGIRRLEIRDVPQPGIGPSDLLLRVASVGLCGTDFHIFAGHANYHTDRLGRPVPLERSPQILGHEIAGVIEEAGPEVRDLHPGDRVVIDQGRNCSSARRTPPCEYCATGDSHQCAEYAEHGITGLPGGLAEFLAIPAVNAIRIESPLEPPEAALTEPLGCIVHTCDVVQRTESRYRIGADDPGHRVQTTLVIGAGPAGLLFVQYLRQALGYDGRLLVSEPSARKRVLAGRFGAETIDPAAVDLVEAVQSLTAGRKVELLVDAAGWAGLFTCVPGLLRKQGTLVLYGHGHAGVDVSVLSGVQFLEPALIATVGASGGFDSDGRPVTYRRALRLIEEGRIEAGALITHRYRSLDAVPRAFGGEHHDADYVKGVVVL